MRFMRTFRFKIGSCKSSQEQTSTDTERMLPHACKGVNGATPFAWGRGAHRWMETALFRRD
jgi:hypothetical protein